MAKQKPSKAIAVDKPNFRTVMFRVRGTSPYCQSKFSNKARQKMRDKQEAGPAAKTTRGRTPRDFDADYKQAQYVSTEGWNGIPAGAFRSAMISACKTVDATMTRAKLCIFIEPDGVEREDFTPLVRIHGKPRKLESTMTNATGVADIRVRPLWDEWYVDLRIGYDADMIPLESVANLILRAGLQVGIGEGRPDSRHSSGCGWGMFSVEGSQREKPSQVASRRVEPCPVEAAESGPVASSLVGPSQV